MKKVGIKIVVINIYWELGMECYWVLFILESVLFGIKFVEDFFLVNVNGDIVFINGIIKYLIVNDWVN